MNFSSLITDAKSARLAHALAASIPTKRTPATAQCPVCGRFLRVLGRGVIQSFEKHTNPNAQDMPCSLSGRPVMM